MGEGITVSDASKLSSSMVKRTSLEKSLLVTDLQVSSISTLEKASEEDLKFVDMNTELIA